MPLRRGDRVVFQTLLSPRLQCVDDRLFDSFVQIYTTSDYQPGLVSATVLP